ncbi:MAG TPA: pyrimidine 5'-nucleotidase [Herpetosiphonaceae bacterium]|nr:pyrimidine 5'-nucleotidase [Herpetosiphonaceae bacterium]
MPLRIALYDLDNTLYPHTVGLMDLINERINLFVQERLQMDPAAAMALRHQYFQAYGTTLAGLQKHHSLVETEDYLNFVHDIALDLLTADSGELGAALGALPLEKIIFTNSPREHALRVLTRMGLHDHFSRIFDIRAFEFAAKPHPNAYQVALLALGASGEECVLFEDTPANLAPAKAVGMTTVLIAPEGTPLHPDADWMATDVLAATHRIHALVSEIMAPRAG